jgi:hypothetical protein
MSQTLLLPSQDLLSFKPKTRPFHRRTQSNSAYDMNTLVHGNVPAPQEQAIEEIVNTHNIIGSAVTLKALENAKQIDIEKQVIVDDIDEIPRTTGIIVSHKNQNSNPMNFIKKRNLSCFTSFVNACPIKKIDLLNEPQKLDEMTGLNTIYEKRNSVDSFDPESMDVNSPYAVSKDVSKEFSKDAIIMEDTLSNHDNDDDNSKIKIQEINETLIASNDYLDKRNKFIDDLKRKLSMTKPTITTSSNPNQYLPRQYNTLKSSTPNSMTNIPSNVNPYHTANFTTKNSLSKISKPINERPKSHTVIVPPTMNARPSLPKKEQKDANSMISFTKYFSSSSLLNQVECRTPNSGDANKKIKELLNTASIKKQQSFKDNSKDMKDRNNISDITQQGSAAKIASLTSQLSNLSSKTVTLEDQVKSLMRVIEQLTSENRGLMHRNHEQESRIKKLEEMSLKNEEDVSSQKTRHTLKLTSESEKKLSLKQDHSSNNILNTTDISTLESPNAEKSYLQQKGTGKKSQTSPFSLTDQSFKSSRYYKDYKKGGEKVLNSYRATLKKIHNDDKKTIKKKL